MKTSPTYALVASICCLCAPAQEDYTGLQAYAQLQAMPAEFKEFCLLNCLAHGEFLISFLKEEKASYIQGLKDLLALRLKSAQSLPEPYAKIYSEATEAILEIANEFSDTMTTQEFHEKSKRILAIEKALITNCPEPYRKTLLCTKYISMQLHLRSAHALIKYKEAVATKQNMTPKEQAIYEIEWVLNMYKTIYAPQAPPFFVATWGQSFAELEAEYQRMREREYLISMIGYETPLDTPSWRFALQLCAASMKAQAACAQGDIKSFQAHLVRLRPSSACSPRLKDAWRAILDELQAIQQAEPAQERLKRYKDWRLRPAQNDEEKLIRFALFSMSSKVAQALDPERESKQPNLADEVARLGAPTRMWEEEQQLLKNSLRHSKVMNIEISNGQMLCGQLSVEIQKAMQEGFVSVGLAYKGVGFEVSLHDMRLLRAEVDYGNEPCPKIEAGIQPYENGGACFTLRNSQSLAEWEAQLKALEPQKWLYGLLHVENTMNVQQLMARVRLIEQYCGLRTFCMALAD